MIFDFVRKEPGAAYVSNQLWLPKSLLRTGPVKGALEFDIQQDGEQQKLILWEESPSHILCPREFLKPERYKDYKFPFVDLRPQFEDVEFEDLITPWNEEQQKAWQALAHNNNGILVLACGKGKTILAVKKIAQRRTPTLVIVPDSGILSQWRESIMGSDKRPPGIKFDGELGLIQGDTFDWKHPITLALVTSLAVRFRDGRIPEEMVRYFGQVIYDEVHRVGAPMFSLTAAPFYGDRLGLTATLKREDGYDPIYRYHIGEPFYTDLTQELTPTVYFQKTETRLNLEETLVEGKVNISRLRVVLGTDLRSNIYRYWCIRKTLDAGRKILCLSHSRAQLRLFHTLFPESGLIIRGSCPPEERMEILRSHQVTFAIARLGSEGVDDQALDTLFWLTPYRSKIALQQSFGRIQRVFPGKQAPLVIVFEDYLTRPLKNLITSLKGNMREKKYAYQTLDTIPQPSTLPQEVQNRYDSIWAEIEFERAEELRKELERAERKREDEAREARERAEGVVGVRRRPRAHGGVQPGGGGESDR